MKTTLHSVLESPRHEHWTILALLAPVAWWAYGGIVDHSFMAEEFQFAWMNWKEFLGFAFFPNNQSFYRPLFCLFWFFSNALWGYHPSFFYLTTAVLHTMASLYVFKIVRQVYRRVDAALVSGIAFLVLAPCSENVNWLASGSHQILCGLGFTFSLYAYLRIPQPAEGPLRKHSRLYLQCAIGMLLALLSSESALVWPAAAFLLGCSSKQRIPKGRQTGPGFFFQQAVTSARAEWTRLAPLVPVWLVFVVFRMIAVRGIGVYGAEQHLSIGKNIFAKITLLLRYLTAPLSSLPLEEPSRFALHSDSMVWIAAMILVLVSWRLIWHLLLLLVLSLPVLTIPSLHHAYFPAMGLSILLGGWMCAVHGAGGNGTTRRPQAFRSAIVYALFGALLGVWVSYARKRTTDWNEAGTWARQVLRQTRTLIPDPKPGTHFYFYELPTMYQRCYVFTWGLNDAIQALYHNHTLLAKQVYANPSEQRVTMNLEASAAEVLQQTEDASVCLRYLSRSAPDIESDLRNCSLDELKLLVNHHK